MKKTRLHIFLPDDLLAMLDNEANEKHPYVERNRSAMLITILERRYRTKLAKQRKTEGRSHESR